jgi:hypothetical protein
MSRPCFSVDLAAKAYLNGFEMLELPDLGDCSPFDWTEAQLFPEFAFFSPERHAYQAR